MKRCASALFLAGVVLLLYRKAIRLWWTYDDAWNLHVVLVNGWSAPFRLRDVWPEGSFNPLRFASYEVLHALAGLDPDHWYRVHLSLIALCAVSLFLALRLFVDTLPALSGALIFAAAPPLSAVAVQLMTMPLLEAMLLATLSLTSFVLASRKRSNVLMLLSALLYLGAMLASGLAVALPILLLVLPERDVRVRARHLVFHFAALAVYLLWRWTVVGVLVSSAGWTVAPRELPALIATFPWKIVTASAGAGLGVGLVAMALVALGAGSAARSRQAAMLLVTGLLLAILPVVPMLKSIPPAAVVGVWVFASAAFAAGVTRLPSGGRYLLMLAACGAVVVANRQEWTARYVESKRMSDEARAFMSLDSSSVLRRPHIPPVAMSELQWLKEVYFHRAKGAGWFYDDLYLCSSPLAGRRVFEYSTQRHEVVESTARIPDFTQAWCASIRGNAPLTAEFDHRGESLFWRFGPYRDGRWTVVLADGLQAFPVPREDGFRLARMTGIAMRIRYDSPAGWVTYSPEIVLDFARRPRVSWSRPAVAAQTP